MVAVGRDRCRAGPGRGARGGDLLGDSPAGGGWTTTTAVPTRIRVVRPARYLGGELQRRETVARTSRSGGSASQMLLEIQTLRGQASSPRGVDLLEDARTETALAGSPKFMGLHQNASARKLPGIVHGEQPPGGASSFARESQRRHRISTPYLETGSRSRSTMRSGPKVSRRER